MPCVLITGASAGIGAAFARRLARERYELVLLARDAERLERAAEQYRRESGIAVEVLEADLATEQGIAAAERRLRQGVDLLINNAGFGHRDTYLKVPISAEVTMLRVHCEAVLRLSSAALPNMIARGRGGVINVASVGAFFARGTYTASKAWAVSFSESVAQDLADSGVRVMALCPGWVRTEFHERAAIDISSVPGFMWLDADWLVGQALRDFRRGKIISIPSLRYKAIVGLKRALPRGVSGRIASRTLRRYR